MPQTLTTVQGDTRGPPGKARLQRRTAVRYAYAGNTEHLEIAIFPAGVTIVVPQTQAAVR